MRPHLVLVLCCLSATVPASAQNTTSTCQRVSLPETAVELLAEAVDETICIELLHTSPLLRVWNFEKHSLETASGSDTTINCDNGRIAGLYESPIVIGDRSLLRLRFCDIYTYEHTICSSDACSGKKLTAFFHAAHPDNGASFQFLDSFRYWPCSEIKRIYMRAWEQYKEDPGSKPLEVGPIVTANGSSAFTFIDGDPFRVTRSMPLKFVNVTYYCGDQSTRWKNALAAMRAAATIGPVPMHVAPGDFPSKDPPVLEGPMPDHSNTAVIAGVVVGVLVLITAVGVGLYVRRRRRMRRRHAPAAASLGPDEHAMNPKPPLPPASSSANTGKASRTSGAWTNASLGSVVQAVSDTSHPLAMTDASAPPQIFTPLLDASAIISGQRSEIGPVFVEGDSELNLYTSRADARASTSHGSGPPTGPSAPRGTPDETSTSASDFVQSGDSRVVATRSSALIGHVANTVWSMQHTIGDAKLQKHYLIGTGAFSLVYRGSWRGLDVAIKVVVFEGSMQSRETARIVSEAAIATSLTHENVVQTYTHDIVRLDQESNNSNIYKLYLIQEYCNGGNIHALFNDEAFQRALAAQTRPLLLELRVLRSIASALDYLHSKRVIHADVKQQNVMIKYNSDSYESAREAVLAGEGRLKMVDFGLAQRLRDNDPHRSCFHAGTRWYAAPEVLRESRLYLSSDVYSFGVLAWEIVTHLSIATRPSSTGAHETASEHEEAPTAENTAEPAEESAQRNAWMQNPAFPSMPDAIPDATGELIAACLRLDYQERPPIAEVLATLETIIADALSGP